MSLLQSQLEQLQQTVLKKQLMLDALSSEKSALEYRLADALRDKARSQSLRRGRWVMEGGMRGRKEDDNGWRDVEDGPDEEKAHPRSISRILPQGLPRRLLLWVNDWDELGLSVLQLMVHSPTFRLIVFLYFSLLNIGFIVLLLRKRRCCVCFNTVDRGFAEYPSRWKRQLRERDEHEGQGRHFPRCDDKPG